MASSSDNLEEKFLKCNFSDEITRKYKNILVKYYEIRNFNEKLLKLIKHLKKNGYNVYILSDNNIDTYNYYRNHKLFSNIDGWVVSCNYNTVKSEGKLFEIILEKYNLIPEECYFIDDREKNITIANKYRINGYQFNEKQDINFLYTDMKKHGIKI